MELYKQVIVLLLITKRQEQVVAQVNLSELSKAAGGTRSKGEEETEKQKSREAGAKAVPITVFYLSRFAYS
jgi:hypothetical protein